MAATIDTLRLAKRFKDARLSDEQAELLAEVFRETGEANLSLLATKSDLALLREELARRMDNLEHRLEAMEQRLLVKLGGLMAAGVVLVGALVALF
jgi:hypothetical protein